MAAIGNLYTPSTLTDFECWSIRTDLSTISNGFKFQSFKHFWSTSLQSTSLGEQTVAKFNMISDKISFAKMAIY